MENMTVSSILMSVLVVAVIWAVNWAWLRPKKLERRLRQRGVSGNSYRLLVGDLTKFTAMRSRALESPMITFSHDYLARVESLRHQLLTEYGKIFVLWAGPRPIIHISKPDMTREAMSKMHDFEKQKINPIVDKVFPGLISYDGDKWAKHRRIINPAFHMEKLKLMIPAFYDSCIEMVDKWEDMIVETGFKEIDVWPYLTELTADVISRAAFGSSYQEGQRLFVLLRQQIGFSLEALRSVYFPGLRYIPTSWNRRFYKGEKEIHMLLEKIINKRKNEMEAGEASKNDLLGILMDSNMREIQEGGGDNNNDNKKKKKKSEKFGMKISEVIEECKLFYLAGQETTSILIAWTLIMLGKYRDWQARAREEVMQTFGNNIPHFEGLNQLKTMTMILHEVLRLYPPVTQLARKTKNEIKLGEVSLPEGVFINFQVLFLHHDKEIWGEDAAEFKPERFEQGISKATGGNVAFFPFGWGPRMCLGEKFAMTEVKMALTMILQRFFFELSPSYAHAPMAVIFVQPQHGAQIILHKL